MTTREKLNFHKIHNRNIMDDSGITVAELVAKSGQSQGYISRQLSPKYDDPISDVLLNSLRILLKQKWDDRINDAERNRVRCR